jgi:hypothetical protein
MSLGKFSLGENASTLFSKVNVTLNTVGAAEYLDLALSSVTPQTGSALPVAQSMPFAGYITNVYLTVVSGGSTTQTTLTLATGPNPATPTATPFVITIPPSTAAGTVITSSNQIYYFKRGDLLFWSASSASGAVNTGQLSYQIAPTAAGFGFMG